MLELPELETYRAQLADQLAGAQISGLEIDQEKLFPISESDKIRDLIGAAVWYVERKGKYLLFHLDNGKRLLLLLQQSAALYVGSREDAPNRAAQLRVIFGERILYISGLRAGELLLLTAREALDLLASAGPDPLQKNMTLERFTARFAKKRGPIKTALMDQTLLTGIGTVYSDEICYEAEVRPDVKVPGLTEAEWERLYAAVHKVLKEAIEHGGIAAHPLHLNDTSTGGYAQLLRVYGKEGQLCERSGLPIEKIDVSGRKAYAAPLLQTVNE